MLALLPLLTIIPVVFARCDPEVDAYCSNGTSYATRAGIGFLIFAVVFALIFAAGLTRRRRMQRAAAFHTQAIAANQHMPTMTPNGQWTQHVAGGPAVPPAAYGGYAPAYMAPPSGPPPTVEEQYPPPPMYEGKAPQYAPPAGPPPPKEQV